MKKRMVVVGGIIILVIILLLAFVAGGNNAKVMSVSDALSAENVGKKVQVTGTVVANSYAVDANGTLRFSLQDENAASASPTLRVTYSKGVSATFGNGISAICTGRLDQTGELVCTELVTKCPSKYEKSEGALTVPQLLGYGLDAMVGKTVKVSGTVRQLADATQNVRFVIAADNGGEDEGISVVFAGALSNEVADGATVVITGALREDGSLLASDVSLAK